MFNFGNGIGKEIIDGAIKKLSESGPAISDAIGKALQSGWKATVIPPLLMDIGQELPSLWANLPDETKQELFNALVSAVTKALMSYASGKKEF